MTIIRIADALHGLEGNRRIRLAVIILLPALALCSACSRGVNPAAKDRQAGIIYSHISDSGAFDLNLTNAPSPKNPHKVYLYGFIETGSSLHKMALDAYESPSVSDMIPMTIVPVMSILIFRDINGEELSESMVVKLSVLPFGDFALVSDSFTGGMYHLRIDQAVSKRIRRAISESIRNEVWIGIARHINQFVKIDRITLSGDGHSEAELIEHSKRLFLGDIPPGQE